MPDADGWQLSDKTDFRTGLDANETHSSSQSTYLKSVVPRPKEFGFIAKTVDPAAYVGKKLTLSAWVKTDLPDGASAQLWLRVDGDWKQRPAECFDNMFKGRIKGRKEWARYEVSVEVPPASQKIVYGVLLNGTGQLWLDDVLLEDREGAISSK